MLTKPGKTKQWEIDPMQATLVTLTSDTLLWSEIPFPPHSCRDVRWYQIT